MGDEEFYTTGSALKGDTRSAGREDPLPPRRRPRSAHGTWPCGGPAARRWGTLSPAGWHGAVTLGASVGGDQGEGRGLTRLGRRFLFWGRLLSLSWSGDRAGVAADPKERPRRPRGKAPQLQTTLRQQAAGRPACGPVSHTRVHTRTRTDAGHSRALLNCEVLRDARFTAGRARRPPWETVLFPGGLSLSK